MGTARQITIRPGDADQEPRERPLQFALIRRLFRYTRPYRGRRNQLLGLVLLRSIQLPLLAWAVGAVISGPIAAGDIRGIVVGTLGFAALAAFTEFTMQYRHRFALELGEAVVHDLRNELFAHIQRMPLSFFNQTKLGRVISRIISDVEAVRLGVQNVFFVSLVALGQMTVAMILMVYFDRVLFLVVAGMVPVMWGLNHLLRRRLSRILRDMQESFSRITATMAETVSGIRVTQGFVRQDVNADIFRGLVTDHSRHNLDMARTSGLLFQLLDVNSQFFIAAVLLIGGYRSLHPDIQAPLGNLIQFFFLAEIFFRPVQILGNTYNNALLAMAGAERVFRLLDLPPEWEDAPGARALDDVRGRVEFRRLGFAYRPDAPPVLHDISFVAEPGQTIALVGHTGSGKTTTVNLAAKFFLPTSGEILIDGVEIRELRADSLHRHMGIVQQQNFLFSGTVMDNIRIGRPEATDEEVREAARRLDCLDLIESLPDGFLTVVGEGGSGISRGQQQLICFTRALLANPEIFILDEATSSVDSMTEARIQQALRTLLSGRTSFVIAHRLSTIRDADLVLVFDHGRIVERGTHAELLRQGRVYAALYREFVASGANGH